MADVSEIEKLDILADAVAEAFTDAYYYALEKDRATISTFYAPKVVASDCTEPFIAWNGTIYNEGTEFQDFYEGLTHTHYDVECLNVDILNTKALPATAVKGGSGDDAKDLDRRMSITIQATGSVRLEKALTGPIREFSDIFTLVPNPERLPTGPVAPDFKAGWKKQWVIQTQNFRFTEWGASEIAVAKGETLEDVKMDEKDRVRNKGIANQFAAAGLLIKGKGKA